MIDTPAPTVQQAKSDLVTQLRAFLQDRIRDGDQIRCRLRDALNYFDDQYIDQSDAREAIADIRGNFRWLIDTINAFLLEQTDVLFINGNSGLGKTHFVRQLTSGLRTADDQLALAPIKARLVYCHFSRTDNEVSANALEFLKNLVHNLFRYDAYLKHYSHLVQKLLIDRDENFQILNIRKSI
jgi:hypothetical protein